MNELVKSIVQDVFGDQAVYCGTRGSYNSFVADSFSFNINWNGELTHLSKSSFFFIHVRGDICYSMVPYEGIEDFQKKLENCLKFLSEEEMSGGKATLTLRHLLESGWKIKVISDLLSRFEKLDDQGSTFLHIKDIFQKCFTVTTEAGEYELSVDDPNLIDVLSQINKWLELLRS